MPLIVVRNNEVEQTDFNLFISIDQLLRSRLKLLSS